MVSEFSSTCIISHWRKSVTLPVLFLLCVRCGQLLCSAGAAAPGAVAAVCGGQSGSATARLRATAASTAWGTGYSTRPATSTPATTPSPSGTPNRWGAIYILPIKNDLSEMHTVRLDQQIYTVSEWPAHQNLRYPMEKGLEYIFYHQPTLDIQTLN